MFVLAKDASPGFYRYRRHIIQIVKKASSRWPMQPSKDRVPYRSWIEKYGSMNRGWLPPDLQLVPIKTPRWYEAHVRRKLRNMGPTRSDRASSETSHRSSLDVGCSS